MTDQQERVALLPCPFCGSEAVIQEGNNGMRSERFKAQCTNRPPKSCTVNARSRYCQTPEIAAAAWNTRAAMPAPTVQEAATHWAITSPSGMHIGLWADYETAKRVFDEEVNGGTLMPMRALAEQEGE